MNLSGQPAVTNKVRVSRDTGIDWNTVGSRDRAVNYSQPRSSAPGSESETDRIVSYRSECNCYTTVFFASSDKLSLNSTLPLSISVRCIDDIEIPIPIVQQKSTNESWTSWHGPSSVMRVLVSIRSGVRGFG